MYRPSHWDVFVLTEFWYLGALVEVVVLHTSRSANPNLGRFLHFLVVLTAVVAHCLRPLGDEHLVVDVVVVEVPDGKRRGLRTVGYFAVPYQINTFFPR